MRTGHQREDGTGLGTIHHDHRDVRSGIDPGGDFEVTGRFLARRGRSGSDGERRSLSRGKEWQERKDVEGNERKTN